MAIIRGLVGRSSESGGHPDIHRVDTNIQTTALPGGLAAGANIEFDIIVQHAYMLSGYGGGGTIQLDLEIPTGGTEIFWQMRNSLFRFVAPVTGKIKVLNPAAGSTAHVSCVELT